MTDRTQKITKLLFAAGGAAIGIFLIAKYHKKIIRKLTQTKNMILHDYAKIQRTVFEIEIINDTNKCEEVITILKKHCNEFPVVGFDCEWVSVNSERRKVALIQLCSSQGLCALIRVCKFSRIPLSLKQILENPEIIKVGVTPYNDAKYLQQDYGINVYGTFDLRFLAILSKHKAEGLAKLSEAALGIELNKDWRIRCSDWENETMSQQQIDYAAKDAFVAVEIFRKLYNSILPKEKDVDSIRRFCDSYTDVPFNNKLSQINFKLENENSPARKLLAKENIPKISKRSYTSRTTPLYHNCMLQAPDGELLCTIDRRKAAWYVSKGLGTEISQEPTYIVRLNFEPAGRANGEVGEYYRSVRENRCVVCGQTNDLIRKNVIPHEYRKYFPNIMKDKTSHDILLLCIECHKLSNLRDLKLRQLLEQKCDAPLTTDTTAEDSQAARKLISEQRMARALFGQTKIPEKRRNEIKECLEKAYPKQEINEEFARKLLAIEVPKLGRFNPPHGELVVKKYKETEGLVKLETLWRQHFLNSMHPCTEFMPVLWDVNHNKNRLEMRANEGRVDADDLKIAGVNAVVMPRLTPARIVESKKETSEDPTEFNSEEFKDNVEEVVDLSSDWESYHSASNSSAKFDPDRTLTEDDRYFSDATSVKSFYETVRSDGSTLDDFQSFASSLTERPSYDSDGSRSSLFSTDSDTEIEDDQIGKMEM